MELNFNKLAGDILPAVIQDNTTGKVLMLGFMNKEAYDKTVSTGVSDIFQPHKKPALDKRGGVWLFYAGCFHSTRLRSGYPFDQGRSRRSGLSHGSRHMLG